MSDQAATGPNGRDTLISAGDGIIARGFAVVLERLPSPFAVTVGTAHRLVYANAAFRQLFPHEVLVVPSTKSIEFLFPERNRAALLALLNEALRTGVAVRNRPVEHTVVPAFPLVCSVWPEVRGDGGGETLVMEFHVATDADLSHDIQRDVAERLLLSALRERDAATLAEAERVSAAFLASETRRLAASLDVATTLAAMERMSLPIAGAWCIVDTLDDDGAMHRLGIIHPDPELQLVIAAMGDRWPPRHGDVFGLPSIMTSAVTSIVSNDVEASLLASTEDVEVREYLRALHAGPLLTVPLIIRAQLIGAVTFVSPPHYRYTDVDIELAEDLASRAAMSLDRAHAHAHALDLIASADSANAGKAKFLGMMSHELRTPLNAIGGYLDLLEMGLRGPVTEDQLSDLGRIRRAQRYLIGLISDLLNFTRVGSGEYEFKRAHVVAFDVLSTTLAMLDPLIRQKELLFDTFACDASIVILGDEERITQILVNLIGNAVKFSPPGTRLVIDCQCTDDTVEVRVCDTGIGIPADRLEEIFDPFVQITEGLHESQGGIGLGLAISRGLARGMHGDIGVESTLGQGARFTLTLPRAKGPDASARPEATL